METKTNYDLLKSWLEKNKEKFVVCVCAILIFTVGFGTGRAEQEFKNPKQTQANYTTNGAKTEARSKKQEAGEMQATPTAKVIEKTNNAATCLIKGTSSKIYHIQGGAFYDRTTNPVACFTTESEAQAAGYRKSSR